jgi:hypothetical protein
MRSRQMRHDRAPEEEEVRKDLILVRSCCVGCKDWWLACSK